MKLIDKIRAIDAEAADWLEVNGEEMPIYNETADTLDSAFIWEDTPHGHDYWERIAHRLGEV